LLGYAYSSLAVIIAAFGSPKFTFAQCGMVIVNVVKSLVGEGYRDVVNRMNALREGGNAEFERGAKDGSTVAILMCDRPGPGLLAEPEVQAALREVPGEQETITSVLGSKDTGQFVTAGGILMRNYMRRHKEKAGY